MTSRSHRGSTQPAVSDTDGYQVALRGLFAAVALGFVAWSAVATYASVWLASVLRLQGEEIALTFAVTGLSGVAGSLIGGSLVGRGRARLLMFVCSAGQALLSLLLFDTREPAVLAVIGITTVTLLQPVRGIAQRTILASVVAADARERAFVGFRTAMNLGVVAGPAVTALLLLLAGWGAARGCVIVLFAAAALAAGLVPQPRGGGQTGRVSLIRITTDARVLALLAVTAGAWALVSGVEIVLPAVLTRQHQIPVSFWGFSYAIASVAVVASQSPVGNLLARFRLAPRLALGVIVLGTALAPELAGRGMPVVVCTLVLFAVGELVWGPPSEEVVVAMAAEGRQVEYISAVAMSIWIGEGIAGVMGFLVGQYLTPAAAWIGFLGISVATSTAYAVLARREGTVIGT